MESKGTDFGKIFFKSLLKTLEEFLNIQQEEAEDFLNIQNEVLTKNLETIEK